jgi:superfamily II DNA or RNA helicase
MNDLWAHQVLGIEETLAAIARNERRVVLTSPTGGGKTRMACTLIDRWLDEQQRTVIYTNRKLLVEQLAKVLDNHGIVCGVRAAGYQSSEAMVQVSSVQTETSRRKAGRWEICPAERVIIDEAHLHTGPTTIELLEAHYAAGAAIVGLTATPIGLGPYYDTLVLAGENTELQQCGALLPCWHYGPDEPDLWRLKRMPPLGEDFSESQQCEVMMTPTIYGRVLDWYRKLNPDQRPAILFAPGVEESVWFAEQFHASGISAAHIDGETVWINGHLDRSSPEARADVLAASKEGRVKVLCNRFVLREGLDCPWLSHGIFACIFGSLQSYLQAGGRLLRNFPGLDHVTLQDHGGNWWRHGSLNADREWRLTDTAALVAGLREDQLRAKKAKEPGRCPKCAAIIFGPHCRCGWEANVWARSRPVVQIDGTLKEMTGDIFRPRRLCKRSDGPAIWERMYWRSRTARGRRTFRAAAAFFAQENQGSWPDPHWPLMPVEDRDWFLLVEDVPVQRLTPRAAC